MRLANLQSKSKLGFSSFGNIQVFCLVALFILSLNASATDISTVLNSSGLPVDSELYIQTPTQKFERGNVNIPASIAKLWTAYGVLNSVDVNSKGLFKLTLTWLESASQPGTISSVQIESNGSPELNIKQIIEAFQQEGVKKIIGGIKIVSSLKYEKPKDMNEVSDSGYCYNASVGIVNLNRNCVTININANGGKFNDPDLTATIKLDLKMGSYNGTRPFFRWLNKEKSDFEYTIKVTLKDNSSTTSVDVLIPDTQLWIQNKLQRLLTNAGIIFSNATQANDFSLASKIEINEKGTAENLCIALKDSVNIYAQSAFQVITPEVSLDLKNRFRNLQIIDGAGLSKLNRITGTDFFQFMEEIGNSKHFHYFQSCLPSAWQSGTLKQRLLEKKGQIIAKTGSLAGYAHLAGFYYQQNRWQPFVFLLKNEKLSLAELRSLQDKILLEILK